MPDPSHSSPPCSPSSHRPIVVSTWKHGEAANVAAWDALREEGSALDAVEAGARVAEADPDVRTVGRGGYPDQEGIVTLDAAIMDGDRRCGAVAALEEILHPSSVARSVMENTPHILLAGEGARDYAISNGFSTVDLLTDVSRADWEAWRDEQTEADRPAPNIENQSDREGHDTIGILALTADGEMAGVCTTSGTPWKMRGRVGDSPLIGSGLYVDGAVGAACATGWGEAIMRTAASFLAVEAMRQGASPQEACRRVVERVDAFHEDVTDVQVGVLALDPDGRIGAYSLTAGFDTAQYTPRRGNELVEADALRENG